MLSLDHSPAHKQYYWYCSCCCWW